MIFMSSDFMRRLSGFLLFENTNPVEGYSSSYFQSSFFLIICLFLLFIETSFLTQLKDSLKICHFKVTENANKNKFSHIS